MERGISPEVVFIDGTHVKANANMNKQVKHAIPVAADRKAAAGEGIKAREPRRTARIFFGYRRYRASPLAVHDR